MAVVPHEFRRVSVRGVVSDKAIQQTAVQHPWLSTPDSHVSILTVEMSQWVTSPYAVASCVLLPFGLGVEAEAESPSGRRCCPHSSA